MADAIEYTISGALAGRLIRRSANSDTALCISPSGVNIVSMAVRISIKLAVIESTMLEIASGIAIKVVTIESTMLEIVFGIAEREAIMVSDREVTEDARLDINESNVAVTETAKSEIVVDIADKEDIMVSDREATEAVRLDISESNVVVIVVARSVNVVVIELARLDNVEEIWLVRFVNALWRPAERVSIKFSVLVKPAIMASAIGVSDSN
ncbi:MAG: hypothetical protein DRI48_08370 [Chloroflexi bacterium]|nr:MAG: hypothetical protein DRI48_08370 [Chloroflexota bacterium]